MVPQAAKALERLQVFPLRGEHEFAVLDPSQAQNPVSEVAHLGTTPSHDDHLQAIVVNQEFGRAFLRAQGRILLGAGRQARVFRLEASQPVTPPANILKEVEVDAHQLRTPNRSPKSPQRPTHQRRMERIQENAISQVQS